MVKRKQRPPARRGRRKPTPAPPPVTPIYPGSLKEWLDYVMPDQNDGDWVPMWPPDAFAIGAALLRRTGAYVDLVNGEDLRSSIPVLSPDDARKAGAQWRTDLDEVFDTQQASKTNRKRKRIRDVCPPPIRQAWTELRSAGAIPLGELRKYPRLTAAAITLCTVSDGACAGIGIGGEEDSGGKPRLSAFLAAAEQVAKDPNEFRSYCLHIPPSKIAVLGKRHTPQRGCSIRSLTHHLALYTATEIQAIWPAPIEKTQEEIDVFNVLMLPWPTDVVAADFSMHRQPGVYRYFDYRPAALTSPPAVERVRRALARARSYVDRVHAVVLPELALDQKEFAAIERVVSAERAILVSGVRKAPCKETEGMPSNTCAIQTYGLSVQADNTAKSPRSEDLDAHRRTQSKHHRWCLDRRQILQYQLGGRLPASRDCWEYTYLGPREIHFVTLTSWLTISTLICEDLARQEPVTEVLRAVGPNLIFALLMDGPQLKSRWASRYASVLAEDPGCSVLSLTSLGMAARSRPSDVTPANDKSLFVALWRDAIYGEQEICLERDHDACVLSLVCKTKDEFTIDGDRRRAHFPVFAGCQSFQTLARA